MIHFYSVHKENWPKAPWKCQFCPRGFANKHFLERHLVSHETIPNKNKKEKEKETTKILKKKNSKKRKSKKENFTKRIKQKNSKKPKPKKAKKENKLKCTECSKTFARPSQLRNHNYSHFGGHPFKCDICGKGFVKAHKMKIHIRSYILRNTISILHGVLQGALWGSLGAVWEWLLSSHARAVFIFGSVEHLFFLHTHPIFFHYYSNRPYGRETS